MTRELDGIFRDLGLTQYLDAFIDQGFDTWDTILDIQESDLDALGVKLGHRRKLQRRIANARGFASSVKVSTEDAKKDAVRHEPARSEPGHENNGVVKRKYRRHPKPDENAPERPPSAYVLFSNKMREDLKSQNLTFTEIAKLVGENWQSLPAAEKEGYESQANADKEKYHRDLLEYKKTPEYRKYAQYLHEFKEKQAKQNQAHEASKRAKMEPSRQRHGSTSSSSNTTPNHSVSSGSDGLYGSEKLSRRSGVNSSASTLPSSVSQRNSMDEPISGTRAPIAEQDQGRQSLPPLSAMLDSGKMLVGAAASADGNPYGFGFVTANHRHPALDGPSAVPGPRMPTLHHEPSSSGSISSSNSATSISRPPGERSLPIHAPLTGRPTAAPIQAVYAGSPTSSLNGPLSQSDQRKPLGSTHGPQGYGFQSSSSAFQNMRVQQSGDGDVVMTLVDDPTIGSNRPGVGLDGMNALLKAGEIVGRHN